MLREVPITRPQQPRSLQEAYHEETEYVVFRMTLTANQAPGEQTQLIDNAGDFVWIALSGNATGIYEVRFRPNNERYLSNARIRNVNIVGTAHFPVLLPKPIVIPSGGRIGIDLVELSGAQNVVEIVFLGVRRYLSAQ